MRSASARIAFAQLARRQRREAVEERREQCRVDPGGEQVEAGDERPGPEPPAAAEAGHHEEERREQRSPEQGGEGEALQAVEEEAAERLAVEAVFLLDVKRRVELDRQREDGARETEQAEEGESARDRAEAHARGHRLGPGRGEAETARRDEGERGGGLEPAGDEREAVAVGRVGDSLRHLLVGDVERLRRVGEAVGARHVAAVLDGEQCLGELLRETQQQVGEEESRGERRGGSHGLSSLAWPTRR